MATQTVHDPVCHMDITEEDAKGTSIYGGVTYYFCAMGCKVEFDADPAAVLKAESEYDHSQAMEHGEPASASGATAKKPWWKFWGR
ncbi:MAG TPA: YHS domain-containing protein [Dehalococcoidia bacterium]|nr:YHS domain-containing protein [Dehalococcoidia bacterium]